MRVFNIGTIVGAALLLSMLLLLSATRAPAFFGGMGAWFDANEGMTRPHGAPGMWCGYGMQQAAKAAGYDLPNESWGVWWWYQNAKTQADVAEDGAIAMWPGHVGLSRGISHCPQGQFLYSSCNDGGRCRTRCFPISHIHAWRKL